MRAGGERLRAAGGRERVGADDEVDVAAAVEAREEDIGLLRSSHVDKISRVLEKDQKESCGQKMRAVQRKGEPFSARRGRLARWCNCRFGGMGKSFCG